jgi:hypothetical protein
MNYVEFEKLITENEGGREVLHRKFEKVLMQEKELAKLVLNLKSFQGASVQITRRPKDDSFAMLLLNEAADMYQKGLLKSALRKINSALQHATAENKPFQLAKACRAELFYTVDMFHEACVDLDAVLSVYDHNLLDAEGNPRRKLPTPAYIVYDRKARCMEALGLSEPSAAWFEETASAFKSDKETMKTGQGGTGTTTTASGSFFDFFLPHEVSEDMERFLLEDWEYHATKMQLGAVGESCPFHYHVKPSELDHHAKNVPLQSVLQVHRNKSIPTANYAVKLKYTKDSGRGFFASKAIMPGHLVIEERPFARVLDPRYWRTHCSYCMRQCDAVVPCETCVYVVFCSVECKKAGWRQFHEFECPQMDALALLASCGNLVPYLTYRIFSMRPKSYFMSRQRELDGLLRTRVHPNEVLEIPGYFDSGDVCSTMLLYKREPPVQDMTSNVTMAAYILKILKAGGFFAGHVLADDETSSSLAGPSGDKKESRDEQELIYRLIFHYLCHLPTQTFNITGIEISMTSIDDVVNSTLVGLAACPTMTFVNHSCAPNCAIVPGVRDKFVLVALRPIERGDEITMSYGGVGSIANTPKPMRNLALMRDWGFKCNCTACVQEWPTIEALPVTTNYFCPFCHTTYPAFESSEQCANCSANNIAVQNAAQALERVGDVNLVPWKLGNTAENILNALFNADGAIVQPDRNYWTSLFNLSFLYLLRAGAVHITRLSDNSASLRKPYAPSIILPRSSWTIPTKTRQEALADLPAELKDEVADLAAKFGTTSLDDSSEEPTRVPEPYRSCLAACGAHWPYGIQEEDEEITTKRPFRPIDIQFSDSSEDEDEVETVSSRDVVHSNRYFQ